MRSKRKSSPEDSSVGEKEESIPGPQLDGELQQQTSVCYCNGERQLGTLEFNCALCKRWFHNACLKDLKEISGLPFMVCYNFHCKDCSPEKKETWALKSTQWAHMVVMALSNMAFDLLNNPTSCYVEKTDIKYFHWEREIAPFFETNWESLTPQSRRAKNTWHQTLQRTLTRETDLFIPDPSDENSFALKERDLLTIGPMHEAVRQIGRKSNPSLQALGGIEPAVTEKVEETAVDGPKTRGATKRKTLETFTAPQMKRNKTYK